MPNTMEEDQPKSVLETILEWSQGKPDWLRDALRRIVLEGPPDDGGIDELVSLCRKGKGDSSIMSVATPLQEGHLPVDPGAGKSISLKSISEVVGVNQLAPDQELIFETQGLTVVYGPNGSGKSGYSRILKRACRARHAGEIMPDIFNPPPGGLAKATIALEEAATSIDPILWEDNGESNPKLSAITVFDRDCGTVHIKQKNEVWFRPFGLDIPDDLAGVCQSVKSKLEGLKSTQVDLRDPIFEDPLWTASSDIGKFINQLTPDSDLAELEGVSFSEEDEIRFTQLQTDLQRDPAKAAALQRQRATKVWQMSSMLCELGDQCSDEKLKAIEDAHNRAVSAKNAAGVAATEAFSDLKLQGVGEPVWKDLWESARRYSDNLENQPQGFPPQEGETCLLCHQDIDATTATKLVSFESFIKDDTEARANLAAKDYSDVAAELSGLQLDARLTAGIRQVIAETDPLFAKNALRFMASIRLRRRQLFTALDSGVVQELRSLEPSPKDDLETMAKFFDSYADELSASVDEDQRQALEEELNDLKDRRQVERLTAIAKGEIERLTEVRFVDTCIAETATNTITKLGTHLADALITPKMRDRFQKEIVCLAGDQVRVEVVRSGGKFGSPQYEVKFFANPRAKVHMVLSEGEQTCVALAAYLTELANASHNSALVFDDPVTSLDHRWRQNVASRLVDEAKIRQVVVFTHDLVFVNDLHEIASERSVTTGLGSLSRKGDFTGYFKLGLPWRASGVKDRIDKLQKAVREADKLHFQQDDERYNRAATEIYDDFRATWERALEDVVFAGVVLRHRDYINPKNLRKVTVLEETDIDIFDAGYKKCCDYVRGHDPSRGRDAEAPPPAEILSDIDELAKWADSLKARQRPYT